MFLFIRKCVLEVQETLKKTSGIYGVDGFTAIGQVRGTNYIQPTKMQNHTIDWCWRRDLNPYVFRQWFLRPPGLPISALQHFIEESHPTLHANLHPKGGKDVSYQN